MTDGEMKVKLRRGFTLIEISFALAMLMIIVGAAWLIVHASNRHQDLAWDELAAGEIATSALEHVLAQRECVLTPIGGRKLDDVEKDPRLAGLSVMLYVQSAADNEELVDVRVSVTWRRVEAPLEGREMSVERGVRRRAKS